MPLPSGGVWPPEKYAGVLDQMSIHRAWWTGNAQDLIHAYTNLRYTQANIRPSQYRGGVVGVAARWFWGKPQAPGEYSTKSHVPVAADIATMSSDLLFASPPNLSVDDEATTNRLGEYVEEGLWSAMREAAEKAAALGGVYLRVVWDDDVADMPWLASVDADFALPEFVHEKLKAVTFFKVIERTGGQVVRFLERHEVGRIEYGVFVGGEESLGRPVPLTDYEYTASLADVLDDGQVQLTGIEQMTAFYVPNIRPNKQFDLPVGRSDYQGVESMMDELDEVESSWQRDVRLSKARLMVPEAMLDSQGRGQGATFNPDQELLLGALVPTDTPLTLLQPDIRYEAHQATFQSRLEQIIRGAGYSMDTFSPGDSAGGAVTATEIVQREKRSLTTRDRKIGYWTPVLAAAIEALLAIDLVRFKATVKVQKPKIEFPDAVSPDPNTLAQTILLLDQAKAASTEVKVAYLHPDWTEDQVAEEVARLSGTELQNASEAVNALANTASNLGKAIAAGGIDEATATALMEFLGSKVVDEDGEPIEIGSTDFTGAAERKLAEVREQRATDVAVSAARPAPAPPAPGQRPGPGGPAAVPGKRPTGS